MKSINIHLNNRRVLDVFSIVMLGFCIVMISSCDVGSVLDKEPLDGFSEQAVWEDQALIEAHLSYAYKRLPFGLERTGWILPYSYLGVDENHARLSSAGAIGNIVRGDYGPTTLGPMDVWTGNWGNDNPRTYWAPISQVNKLLEGLERSTIDQSVKDMISAEGRVIRAYAYFRLISHYGGVPLITKTFELDEDFAVARDSYDDVMRFVLDELDEVMDDLPLERNDEHLGRLTRGAAMAIKSRALLYYASPLNNPDNNMQRWQDAADAAKAVIDLNQYALYPDYRELFTEPAGYTEETIWGRPTNHLVEREAYPERLFFPNGNAGFGQVHPLQNLVDDFEMESGLLPENDLLYDPQDPYANRDPRFYATIYYNGAPFQDREIETFVPGGMDSPDGQTSPWNATQTSYYVRKFNDESYCGCTSGPDGSSDPIWIRFRLGEIYLNYAEASYMLGNEETAREFVNMVRSRPGVEMPDVTESGDALWDRIVRERRIELVFESHRFFDARRWMIAEDVFSRTRQRMSVQKDPDTGEVTYEVVDFQPANFNQHNYLAPIPQEAIDQNRLLEQNPGY